MGTSKQEQLDLYMGRTESDEDSSDADDVQNCGREALQAAQSSHIDAKHASANGAYELPHGLSCACQSADTLHARTAHMPDAFATDYITSATADMRAESTDAHSSLSDTDISSSDTDIGSSDADSGSSDADDGSSDADISSSDVDTSSSESDSSFESSDDDPDSVPPVQV